MPQSRLTRPTRLPRRRPRASEFNAILPSNPYPFPCPRPTVCLQSLENYCKWPIIVRTDGIPPRPFSFIGSNASEVEARLSEAPLKVLIADDHPLILAGVRRGLERNEEIEVVGEAHTASEAMRLIERRKPEIVLLDLRMPDVEGTEHIQEVRDRWPEVKVVVLSGSEDRPSVDAALRAGASAFVVKSVGPTDLATILRQVQAGVFIAPAAPARENAVEPSADRPDLTEREETILRAAARGLTTAQISREIWVSEHTVKFHLTNIYRKLGVPNRAAAVRWALEHGLGEG